MSQQQNPLVPILVDTQAAAVDAQKKLIAYHENQIKQLSDALNKVTAERDAYKKESKSLRDEILRLKNPVEEKDNIVEEVE